MKNDLLKLVQDVRQFISFTQSVGKISPQKKRETPHKMEIPPLPKKKKETKIPLPEKIEEKIVKTPLPHPKTSSDLFEKIQKALPHLSLIKTPPSPQIAIIYSNPKDLPFLKNLGSAIERKFYPVKFISSDEINSIQSWEQFLLILSDQEIPGKHPILLEPITKYENNGEEKKILWSTICRHLSPKSS